MGAPRRKVPLTSRRRTDDDGEENGSNITGQEDDLSSLGSGPSEGEVDADADGEASDGSDAVVQRRVGSKKSNGHSVNRENNAKTQDQVSPAKPSAFASTLTDTEVMMNGLQVSDNVNEDGIIKFDQRMESGPVTGQPAVGDEESAQAKFESVAEKRRKEHEEYKKKRDEDPAFVPNRGGFFMHDQRNVGAGQNGFRLSNRGRARGRGGFGVATSVNTHTPSSDFDALWAHDLHESVANTEPAKPEVFKQNSGISSIQQHKVTAPAARTPPPNRSFSRSTHVGNVQLRVFLEGMKDAVVFSGVPVNQHTRLPHHRPPLRRDKPVRVSLPDFPPRYIFPAMDRSFIFIPRAMRPNQQGFGRGRGRGSFSAYGGLASTRNSVFGGSAYTPSIAMSRRSSITRDLGRDAMASPAGSIMSRNRSLLMDVNRPVVRLPPSIDFSVIPQQPQPPQYASSPGSVVNPSQGQVYPTLQRPTTQDWQSTLPMHQPRPQKQVSVAEIESPSALDFPPPQQQQQQPFHQQVPAALNGQTLVHDSNLVSHSRHPSHPSQRGTPLSQIPERAIHAQPFQPYPFQQPQSFYPQQYPTPIYFYSSPTPSMPPSSVSHPAFVPGQQYPYAVPAGPISAPAEAASQLGTVAHESNGMVYYYDSSQLAVNSEDHSNYQNIGFVPSTYAVPQGAVFYPPQ